MNLTLPDCTAAVLIVDDNADTAGVLAGFLSQLGHRVRVAATEAEAQATLVGESPDVAILNLDAAARMAESMEHLSKRPLLIALLKPETAQRFSRKQLAVFDYVFFKAVSPQALADKIAAYVVNRTRILKPDPSAGS
jgi:DNA-binding response OmpR family regulator